MKKVFHNALGYDYEGWFICEVRDYPYEHKTNKPTFVTKNNVTVVSEDPEVQAKLREQETVHQKIYEEMMKVATDLNLEFEEGGDDTFEGEIVLDNENGKKLTDALITLGWERQFIPIGP